MITLTAGRELVGVAEDLIDALPIARRLVIASPDLARTITVRRAGVLLAVCSPSRTEGLSLLRAAGQRRRRCA